MMNKTTEQSSIHQDLEKKSSLELVTGINQEDQKVALVIEKILPQIANIIDVIHEKMATGGRLFYIGAGTSGRLGIVDASECPPTFGVPHDWVIGLMAGGDVALRKSVEHAEDDKEQAYKDLQQFDIDDGDFVIGIAASGTTPYVIGGLQQCQAEGILTGCISCNADSPMSQYANYPITAVVGPEYVTGSTRMKSGTAQKLILNMISTSVMIKLGRVVGNTMVDMQLSNDKLVDRGTKIVMREAGITYAEANKALIGNGSVRKALIALKGIGG